MTLATVVLAITTSSCTFCYQPTTFERKCEELGGHVHTFQMYQSCVLDRAIFEVAPDYDDSGVDLTLEPDCLAVGRPCQ